MSNKQPRSQNRKAAPKTNARSAPAPSSARQGNGEKPPNSATGISAHQRQLLVAQLAYFRAERRGFAPGNELQDWLEAEAEVEMIAGRKPSKPD
jgi:hypothetical protein